LVQRDVLCQLCALPQALQLHRAATVALIWFPTSYFWTCTGQFRIKLFSCNRADLAVLGVCRRWDS
jgi:hypothetical protein